MAGRPGRSGGHNRLPVEVHLLRGTFNATRHGKLLAARGPVWVPTAEALEPLGASGKAFIGRLHATYEMSPLDAEVAIEAAHAVDRLYEIRVRRTNFTLEDQQLLDGHERAWQRALCRVW